MVYVVWSADTFVIVVSATIRMLKFWQEVLARSHEQDLANMSIEFDLLMRNCMCLCLPTARLRDMSQVKMGMTPFIVRHAIRKHGGSTVVYSA